MAKVLVTEQYLNNIADAIRTKNGSQGSYTPAQMSEAINALYHEPSGSIDITQNGIVDVKSKATANVNVPNSYAAADEGKVVSSGKLVAQSPLNVSTNGTYDTTLKNQVIVDVPTGGGGGISGVTSGTVAPNNADGNDGDLYIRFYSLPSNINYKSYLESDGEAYINTGIYANDATGLFLKFKAEDTKSPACGRYSASNQTFGVTLPAVGTVSLDFNTQRRQKSIVDGNDVEVYLSRRISEVDGENIYSLSPGDSFITPAPVILFGIYATNSYGLVPSASRIYRATFTDNGEIVADFIPALDANDVPCMYEAISGNYYHNSGNAGSFSYGGSEVPKESRIIYKKTKGAWHIMNQANT